MEAMTLDIFTVNEKKANRYMALCTLIAAGVPAALFMMITKTLLKNEA